MLIILIYKLIGRKVYIFLTSNTINMKKQIIKVNKNIINHLKEIEGGTYDKKVNVLMDIVDKEMPFVKYTQEQGSMTLYPDTLKRLDSYRITYTETRNNILTRMLILLDELNNTVTEEWIPFKLTNPYNNLLVIEGQLEFNSKELSFNYRGNVYSEKLPSTYIVEGKDLTKELYLWYDNLDWQSIIQVLMENVDEQTVIENKDYILEINDVFKY